MELSAFPSTRMPRSFVDENEQWSQEQFAWEQLNLERVLSLLDDSEEQGSYKSSSLSSSAATTSSSSSSASSSPSPPTGGPAVSFSSSSEEPASSRGLLSSLLEDDDNRGTGLHSFSDETLAASPWNHFSIDRPTFSLF